MPIQVGKTIRSLPLEYVMSAPLLGAIKSQARAAKTTIDFFNNACLVETDDSTPDNPQYEIRQLDLSYRTTETDAGGTESDVTRTISVPMATVFPIPYVGISDINTSFEFEIDSAQEEASNLSLSSEIDFSQGWIGGGIEIKGKVGYEQSFRDTTKQKAKLKMNIHATSSEQPEGMKKILEILNDAVITPPSS